MSAITAKASRKMKKYAVLTREPRCFLGSFDFSWEQRKLGELGTITTGNTPSTSIPDYYSDDGIVWVTPTDICENITFESARKLSDLGQQVGRVVPKNTILVTCIASIGKNTMLGNTGSFNQQINGLTPNENKYDPYFLLTESALWSAKMKGSAAAGTMQIVNRTEFSELKTWLPSLIEQQAIGAFFKQLDHLITLHQRKCALLFSPFQALISMMFTTSTFSWEQRKLGELGTITTGSTPSTSIPDYYSDDGIVWVTPTDICENITFESARKLSDLGQQVGRVVPKNTILVTCIASIGKNTMLGNTGSFNQQINGLTPNEKECDPYFLLTESALWSAKMKSSAAAGTMQIVNRTEFSELKTWLPNLIEQQAISDFFRQLDNLITLHQRKCISFTGRAGRLISTVNKKRITSSWEQRKLSELTSMHARIGWQNLRTSEFLDSGNYMLITGTDFNDGAINFSTCHYVERERYEQDRNIQIHNGSILITKDGTLGKVAYVQGLSMPATLNAGVFNVQIKDANNVDEKYLFQYLKAPFLMDYVDKKATGGTIKHLNQSILVDFPVILPQRSEQTLIGAFFQQLDNLITLHQRKPFLMKWRNSDANRNQTNRLVL